MTYIERANNALTAMHEPADASSAIYYAFWFGRAIVYALLAIAVAIPSRED